MLIEFSNCHTEEQRLVSVQFVKELEGKYTSEKRYLQELHVICHVVCHVMCHVICHVSYHVSCVMSCVMCHVSCVM